LITTALQNNFRKHKPGSLALFASLIAIITVLPLMFVLAYGLNLSLSEWISLWDLRIPKLLWNTLLLALVVTVFSLILGVSTAWIVARKEFVGRKVALWLLLLPLTIPTYVFAHIYTTLLEDDGWLGQLWHFLFGIDALTPDLSNVIGVAFILSLAGFSYIFLLVRASLCHSTQHLEEAARIQGASAKRVFFAVNLPLMRPAIAAGLAVIILHVLSDFGAVSMLRYQTFTLSIYNQMSGRMDYSGAAGLSFVLVILSLSFLTLERFFRKRQRYFSRSQRKFVERTPASKSQLIFIWLWLGLITVFSFLLPLGWMISWSWEAWKNDLIDSEFWQYCFNSGVICFSAATIALIAAFPIAFFHKRQNSLLSQSYLHMSSIGFALPGPVIALGLLSLILSQLPFLYGTLTALIIAMVIRFFPLAVQSQESALQQLTPSIEEAGRVFGARPLENLRRVILPVIQGGMASAWVLVFIDALKELPATLILRPTGFDTLPVRIWIEASEEMLELAAPAALMLVAGTLPAIWIMRKSEKFNE